MIDRVYRDEGKELLREGRERYYRLGSGFFSDRIRGVVNWLGYRLVLGSIYFYDV